MSGRSLCRDRVMYGGGFVQGVCLEGCLSRIQDIQVLVPFRTLITPPPSSRDLSCMDPSRFTGVHWFSRQRSEVNRPPALFVLCFT